MFIGCCSLIVVACCLFVDCLVLLLLGVDCCWRRLLLYMVLGCLSPWVVSVCCDALMVAVVAAVCCGCCR